jgi:rubredoxin
MQDYQCEICGYIYEPVNGDPGANIPPNTAFADLPADWVCPVCGAAKDQFTAVA